jgi:phosphomethylpyrimidine synthase
MRISQDVRRYAEERGLDDDADAQAGMREKAAECVEQGGRIYLPLAE